LASWTRVSTRSTVVALHRPPFAVAIRRALSSRAMALADMGPRLMMIGRTLAAKASASALIEATPYVRCEISDRSFSATAA
jgi:hypothetical protein